MFKLLGDLFLHDPDLAAAWGTWLAVGAAGLALGETYRTRLRTAVSESLRDLTSADIASARDRVGSREVPIKRREREAARRDAL